MVDSAGRNARRLTALAYFVIMAIGVTFSLAGVTTKPIAASFAVDTAVVGYVFTLFSVGYSAGILGNGFLLERVAIGKETAAAAVAAGLAVAAATLLPYLEIFAAAILVYGLAMGVLCSVGYYIIVNLYTGVARAAKVNVLNFFFCTGSVVAPILAGLALQRGVGWQQIYQATLPLAAVAAAWALTARFSFRQAPAAENGGGNSRWGAAVYLIGLALLCYVVAEMSFTYWLVTYLIDRLAADAATASLGLSVFWALMGAGRLAAGPLLARLGIGRYIGAFSLLAMVAFAAVLAARTPLAALGFVAALGFGCSGLYGTILSYGTQQVSRPSSRLTTFFLVIGAGGGILALLLSSWVKQVYGVATVLALAACMLAAMAALVGAAGWLGRPRAGGE